MHVSNLMSHWDREVVLYISVSDDMTWPRLFAQLGLLFLLRLIVKRQNLAGELSDAGFVAKPS